MWGEERVKTEGKAPGRRWAMPAGNGQRGPRGAQQVPGPRRPPSPPPAPCALLQKRHLSAVPEGSLKHNGTALPTSPRSMGSSAQGRRTRPPGTPQGRRMNPTRRLTHASAGARRSGAKPRSARQFVSAETKPGRAKRRRLRPVPSGARAATAEGPVSPFLWL